MKKYWLLAVVGWMVFSSCNHQPDVGQSKQQDSLLVKEMNNPQIKALSAKIENDPKNAENYFIRSNLLKQRNNIRAAFNDMSTAIALDSSNQKYYFAIGDIYLKGANPRGAIDAFGQVLKMDPKNEEALIKIAKVYFYEKDYSNSLQQLDKAEEVNKNNPEIYFIRGMNFKEMGDTNHALIAYQQAVDKKPDFYDAYMELGLLTMKKPGSLAAQYFDNAIRLDSTSSEAYYDKGKFFQDRGEYEKAKTTYHELISNDPQNQYAYFNLGFILIKQDSIDKASRMFDLAIKVSPEYAEAYYYRGLCTLEKGNKDQAIDDFRQALILKPDYEPAQKELNSLTKK